MKNIIMILGTLFIFSACSPQKDNSQTVPAEENKSFKTFDAGNGITCIVWFANYFRKSDSLSCVKTGE